MLSCFEHEETFIIMGPGHESDTLTTEPPGRGFGHFLGERKLCWLLTLSVFHPRCLSSFFTRKISSLSELKEFADNSKKLS